MEDGLSGIKKTPFKYVENGNWQYKDGVYKDEKMNFGVGGGI